MTDVERLLAEKYSHQETPEFESDKERLTRGEPLAYVIGHQPFFGLTIHLDSHPLIPRVETEWWTEQLLQQLRSEEKYLIEEVPQADEPRPSKFSATSFSYEQSELENEKYSCGAENYASPRADTSRSFSFLDLCAGSGAIGCAALKYLPNAHVYFGEVDPAHQATILKNIRENKLDESRATIGIGDLFEPFGDLQFDVIACNPPYIPVERPLEASVANFEPREALFAGSDGLDLIRRIAETLPFRLKPGGVAWIECDSDHAIEASHLFTAQGMPVEILTDQYDAPRILVVQST